MSLIRSSELERQRVAGMIHEGLNQTLSAAMATIQQLKSKGLGIAEAKNQLDLVNSLVSESIHELRDISGNLYPTGLYKFGLHPILAQMTQRLQFKNKEILFEYSSNIKGIRFKKEVEINFYRMVQEVIKNSIQHANPKKITLSINYVNNLLNLTIKDDGEGINLNNLEYKKMSTFGILTTEARAKSIGAELKILTQKEQGFKIEITLITKIINL